MKTIPLSFLKIPGIPINSHPGAFGCARKYNFHEGIDLYGSPGDSVYACRDGIVVAKGAFTGPSTGTDWWLDTDAVIIQDEDGYYVYGEVRSDLNVGVQVRAGDEIAKLTPVLPAHKYRPDIPGHSTTMLHLERYSAEYDVSLGWSSWNKLADRPKYLLDPTPALINILRHSPRPINFLTL